MKKFAHALTLGIASALIITGTAVADPTPTPTPTVTPSATPTPQTPAPSPTQTPSQTPTPSTDPTPSATVPPSETPTPSATPTPTPTVTPMARGRFQVKSPILSYYKKLGGPRGKLGEPTSDQFVAGRNVTVQRFKNGNIYWRKDVGHTHVMSAHLAKYGQFGFEHGFMGVPVKGEFRGNDGRSRLNWFEGGTTIIKHPKHGTHEVHGLIRNKWHSLGAEGYYGAPTTDEFKGNDRGRSRLSWFAGPDGPRTIIWTPGIGTHEVRGRIRDTWHAFGGEGGALGAPTSDEFTGQNGARVSRFERGLIIWTPSTGARAVFGALLANYSTRGWEGGDLGAPTSNEWRFRDGWGQDFQNGRLLFMDNGSYRTQVRTNPYVRSVRAEDVKHTYRKGCPVGPSNLRVVEMNHLGYDGRIKRGQLIVHRDTVGRVTRAFGSSQWESFPINRMSNPNVWRGKDVPMMEANNTSAFNCRPVVGNPYRMSPHSYGRAVDINTQQNPYFDGRRWYPSNGSRWIRQRHGKGVLTGRDPMTRGMQANGFFWGGNWASKDYHHFQVN